MKKLNNFCQKYSKQIIFLLFLAGFFVRLAYLYYCNEYNSYNGDEGFFGTIAGNLAKGLGFTYNGSFYASRSPLLMFIGAIWSKIFGYSILKIHILGVLLGSFVPIITYYIGIKLSKNYLAGTLASLYTVFYPFLIHEAHFYDPENIFVPLLLLYFLNLLYCLDNKKSLTCPIISGLIFALVLYSRTTMILFLPFLFLFLILKKWNFKEIFVYFSLKILVLVCLIAPWSFYASHNSGQFIFLTYGSNSAIYGGNNYVALNNPKLSGSWVNLWREKSEEIIKLTGKYDYLPPDKEIHYTLLFWQKNLKRLPLLMLNKLKHQWIGIPKHPDNNTWKDNLLGIFTYTWMLPFLFIYLLYYKPYGGDLFWLFAGYFTFVALAVYGSTRFRLPLDPLIIIFTLQYLLKYKFT